MRGLTPRANGRNVANRWPTTPNIVDVTFLRPFACCRILFGVVVQSLKPVKLLAPGKRT